VLVLIPVGALIRSGVGALPRLFDTGGRLGIDPLEAAITSITYATIATVLATVIGGLTAVAIADRTAGGRILDRIVLLPLGTSAVTIGLGFLIALDWPIDLRASRWLVPIAHARGRSVRHPDHGTSVGRRARTTP
jgi:thiamine transport system permease protein